MCLLNSKVSTRDDGEERERGEEIGRACLNEIGCKSNGWKDADIYVLSLG